MPARPRSIRTGEVVLVDLRPHWVFLIGPLAATVVVVSAAVAFDVGFVHEATAWHWVEGAVAAVPLAWLAVRFVRWRSSGLAITSERVVGFGGLGSRSESEARFEEIDRVDVDQTLARRALGTGRLELTLLADGSVWTLEDVRKPEVVRRIIDRRRPPLPGFRPVPR